MTWFVRQALAGVVGWLWFCPTIAAAMTISLEQVSGRPYILAEGSIQSGDMWKLAVLALSDENIKFVVLISEGGSVYDAIEIGGAIRYFGLDTYVPAGQYCYSACMFAFIGGAARGAGEGASIGVHQFYGADDYASSATTQRETQLLSGRILEHVLEMGVAPEVLAYALRTPPSDIHIFAQDELSRLRIITQE